MTKTNSSFRRRLTRGSREPRDESRTKDIGGGKKNCGCFGGMTTCFELKLKDEIIKTKPSNKHTYSTGKEDKYCSVLHYKIKTFFQKIKENLSPHNVHIYT